MVTLAQTELVLLLILCAGLLLPELLRRLKVPYITGLILAGSLMGPYGLQYVQSNETIKFFGFLGSSFLMLMAGLAVHTKHFKSGKTTIMAITNGLIPFLFGLAIGRLFGYSWFTSLLIGTIFISSSAAIIVNAVKNAGLLKRDIGQSIISSTVILDILSLFILAVALQTVSPITNLPLPIYFLILLASVFILKKILPGFSKICIGHLCTHFKGNKDVYEDQLHVVIVILIGVLVFFSALGVNPIVASFIVGILLSDVITSAKLYDKIHTMAYGLFIPVFFFIIGMQMDLSILFTFNIQNLLMISIVLGLIIAKTGSGILGGTLAGYPFKESLLFGVGSMAQLTTTLAVVYAASTLSILDETLVTSVVMLSVVTTLLSPYLLNLLSETPS